MNDDSADPGPLTEPDDTQPLPASQKDELKATRFRLGISAVICCTLGVLLLPYGKYDAFSAALIRVGILGATGWMAFPTLSRMRFRPKSPIFYWVFGLATAAVVARPKLAIFIIPLAVILAGLLLFKIPTDNKPDE